MWLGHADARQVYDLPATGLKELSVYDRKSRSETCKEKGSLTASRRLAAHQHGRAIWKVAFSLIGLWIGVLMLERRRCGMALTDVMAMSALRALCRVA